MPRPRTVRVLRGGVAASVATFAALLSHVTAGGAIPGWLGIVVPWMLSFAVCTVLAGRRLSLLRLVPAVAVSQLLFHALFTVGSYTPAAVTGHQHDHAAMLTETAATPTASAVDLTMWGWHAVAALVTIAVLHRGERTVRLLVELAGRLLLRVRRRVLAGVVHVHPLPPRLVASAVVERLPRFGWHPSAVGRRGPPLLSPV